MAHVRRELKCLCATQATISKTPKENLDAVAREDIFPKRIAIPNKLLAGFGKANSICIAPVTQTGTTIVLL